MSTPEDSNDGGFWLVEGSEEYEDVKHMLGGCMMGKGEVGRLEIWKIENLDLLQRFDRKTSRLLKLAAWTNIKSLGNENDLQGICHRGFSFKKPAGGMEFAVGNLDLNYMSGSDEHTVIYSDVAVGRSFVFDALDPAKTDIPAGYDSFYIPTSPLDRDNDGEFSLVEFQAAATFDGRDPS